MSGTVSLNSVIVSMKKQLNIYKVHVSTSQKDCKIVVTTRINKFLAYCH